MKKILVLVTALFITATMFGVNLLFPLERAPEVTGYFGEYRDGLQSLEMGKHFHRGIDFSTGSMTGLDVLASAEGYVESFAINTPGYGNTLTLVFPGVKNLVTNEDGIKFLFGHLESAGDLSSQIGRKVREVYERTKKEFGESYAKLVFDPREFPVKKGTVVAKSGDSGNVAPHLHVEVTGMEDWELLNPGLYLDIGNPKTSIDILGIRIDGTTYPLNPGQKPTLQITENSEIDLHTRVQLERHPINPRTVELYLDDSLVYQIDFMVLNSDQSNEIDEVYIDSTPSDYWFRLHTVSTMSAVTVNRWKDIDLSYPHEARIVVKDHWGNSSTRTFRIELRR